MDKPQIPAWSYDSAKERADSITHNCKVSTSRPVVLIPSCKPPQPTPPESKDSPSRSSSDMPRKKSNVIVSQHKPSTPIIKTVIKDSEGDDSAEEEIVTAGARATLNNSPPRHVAPRPNVTFETHRLPDEKLSDEESSEPGSESKDSEESEVEVQATKPRHVGFPLVEELPDWFPENIKQMYRVDRHGGALSYKELNEITRYRAALEIIYRRKWREYIKAGDARWKLQQALHHLKRRPLTKPFYKYRKGQSRAWKAKALTLWKRLDKTHEGILILESTININFRQERVMHEKYLMGRRK